MEKTKCLYCKKSLVSIGNSRKNGNGINDWTGRPFHKKCNNEVNEIRKFNPDYVRSLFIPKNMNQ